MCIESDGEEEEESYFEERFWYFVIPAGIILALSIILEFTTDLLILSQILAIIAMILAAPGIVTEAIEDVKNKRITANILMIVAAIASFFIFHGQEGATAIVLYAIAEHLEEITTDKSRNAIKDLLKLVPDTALLKTDEGFQVVNTEDIHVGQIIGIKPGMKVPLDGLIVKGESYLDQSAITGESLPIYKKEGEEVFAGSINDESFIEVEVTRESYNTVVAQIAESIKIARLNKSKHEKFIEKFAKYYTPIILISSLIVMIVPVLLGLNFYEWFYRGLILLVVSCPCALTLSTPLANIAALTKLAKDGILVKGNRFIEKVNEIDMIAFDKTGTLTEGALKVFDIVHFSNDLEEIVKLSSSLEVLSEHPIARAIVDYSSELNLSLYNVENFKIIKGRGIMGEINGTLYHVGSEAFLKELDYNIPDDIHEKIEQSGTIPIFLGSNKEVLGVISIRDVLRMTAPILMKGLRKRKIKSIMISGDNQNVCNTIGACLDIDDSYGELLPDQKLEQIKRLKSENKGVAMVGDGINDAPALALSDLGIALGASATDLTMETADVIIMSDDLKKVLTFIDISKKTNRKIRQNIWTSIIIKLSFAILTVIGLMTLWLAVGIGDMGVSLAIMLNSMTIFAFKDKYKTYTRDKLESKAKFIVCNTCNTKNIIPQHHGRDMERDKDKLICWTKLLNIEGEEPCEEELPLFCPKCENKLQII